MTADITVVIGGVRSGKSRFAADLATRLAGDRPVALVATARRGPSAGMDTRIDTHRANRPEHWETVEAPLDLAEALRPASGVGVVLIDCLTMWISNILYECGEGDAPDFEARARADLDRRVEDLLDGLRKTSVPVVLVTNEVGAGVAPPTRLGVVFADLQGEVNQKMASQAGSVWLMVAGIPVQIK